MTSTWLDGTLTKAELAGVLAVAQHEDDLARLVTVVERTERLVDRAPERRRRIGRDRGRQRGGERLRVVRERRADGDLVPERADTRDIFRTKPREELRARGAQQRQVALHAAGDIQHDDEPDRPGRVVELGDRLRRAFVAHFEAVLREGRDEPAVPIRHGGEDSNGVAPAAEDGLIRPGGAEHTNETGNECPAREELLHAYHSLHPQARHHLQSGTEFSIPRFRILSVCDVLKGQRAVATSCSMIDGVSTIARSSPSSRTTRARKYWSSNFSNTSRGFAPFSFDDDAMVSVKIDS